MFLQEINEKEFQYKNTRKVLHCTMKIYKNRVSLNICTYYTYSIFSSSIYFESQKHEMKSIYHNEMQSTTNKTKTKKIIDKKVKIIGLMNVQSS